MTLAESIARQSARLLEAGDAPRAVALISDAAMRGDGEALNELALWHVYGYPVPREFGLARVLFGRAARAGYQSAATTHAVFVALGAGGRPDWPTASRLIEIAAESDPVAARQLALLHAMDIDALGRPLSGFRVKRRSSSPDIEQVRALLSPDECAHMIALAAPLLSPSVVVDSRTGQQRPNPIRTSFGAVLGPIQQDLITHALNMRFAAATGTHVDQGEPLVVLRYEPGQQYREHHDCLPGEPNQRCRTVIAYLNDRYDGGETTFAAPDVTIKGRLGDAISFANIQPNGRVNENSRHAGQPIQHGVKWVCTRWIRQANFDPWGLRTPSPHIRGST